MACAMQLVILLHLVYGMCYAACNSITLGIWYVLCSFSVTLGIWYALIACNYVTLGIGMFYAACNSITLGAVCARQLAIMLHLVIGMC
jgi:hypothetical protein